MLPRLLSHFYCYAESRFSNPMVSGLAAYAMKRCSMKRKSKRAGNPRRNHNGPTGNRRSPPVLTEGGSSHWMARAG